MLKRGDGTVEKGIVDRGKAYPSSSNKDLGRALGICKGKRPHSPAAASCAHTYRQGEFFCSIQVAEGLPGN